MGYISAEMNTNDKGFIDGSDVFVYENIDKKIVIKKYKGIFEFYEKHEDGEYTSVYNEKLIKYEFDDINEFRTARKSFLNKGIKLYESDISADMKVLSKYYYDKPSPELNIALYDIETAYHSRSFSDDQIVKIRIVDE